MPTPFYHLSIAQSLLQEARLPEQTRAFLKEHQNAFYLGNTAPDVQSLMDIPRAGTHFFEVPPAPGIRPWDVCFTEYPSIADRHALPPNHAAFMAGYICHLQADIRWMTDVFLPIFGEGSWDRFRTRLFYHNILRTYLDYQVIPELPTNIATLLAAAKPADWLPFVQDKKLIEWREMLTRQLVPGAKIETVDVFAERQGISAEEYNAIVNSEIAMEEKIFVHISRQELIKYRNELIQVNIELLNNYFSA